MRSTTWLAGAACALAVVACGGGGDERLKLTTPGSEDARRSPEQTAQPDQQPKVDRAHVRVVREWADTLRHGDVRGAARYFAVPSTVSNGTAPIRLTSRADVRFFNRTLPCGARLIATEPAAHGYFIATFRLTERPGKGKCGGGTGATARTAMRVRKQLITAWVRVPDAAPSDESGTPS